SFIVNFFHFLSLFSKKLCILWVEGGWVSRRNNSGAAPATLFLARELQYSIYTLHPKLESFLHYAL
ncbi:MAG: hypothetical protein LBC85_02285, partial [Fibromonadaceae bacterium]|nr:hypothetical protein [Fibromonadaceae bacterium]